jgi:hypothetical protein
VPSAPGGHSVALAQFSEHEPPFPPRKHTLLSQSEPEVQEAPNAPGSGLRPASRASPPPVWFPAPPPPSPAASGSETSVAGLVDCDGSGLGAFAEEQAASPKTDATTHRCANFRMGCGAEQQARRRHMGAMSRRGAGRLSTRISSVHGDRYGWRWIVRPSARGAPEKSTPEMTLPLRSCLGAG